MSETDVVDITQPERSSVVQEFLTTVKPEGRYVFFDLDGTITSPEFDVEDHAMVNYLIEPTRFGEWTTKVLRKYPGDFRYIYKDRHVTRSYLVKTLDSNCKCNSWTYSFL